MHTIFQARDINEAHIVAGMLEAEGISAHVCGHYLQGGVGELAGLDFAQVQVDIQDRDRAQVIVQTYQGATETPPPSPTALWPELRFTLTLVGIGALLIFGLSWLLYGNA